MKAKKKSIFTFLILTAYIALIDSTKGIGLLQNDSAKHYQLCDPQLSTENKCVLKKLVKEPDQKCIANLDNNKDQNYYSWTIEGLEVSIHCK